MIKNGVFIGDVQHEFYGSIEGSCAWCSKPVANEWYIKELSTGEFALYNVCGKCYNEGVGQ